jgi:hypothetical protein
MVEVEELYSMSLSYGMGRHSKDFGRSCFSIAIGFEK